MKLLTSCLIAVVSLVLVGCASLNKDECLTADWRLIGFDDGAKGEDVARIGAHRQACAKHNVVPDLNQYEAGYREGVRKFCTPQKGYSKGLDGWRYTGICPKDLEFRFLEAYDDGYELFEIQKEIADIEEEIKDIDEKLVQKKADQIRLENKVVSDISTEAERQAALVELTDVLADIKKDELAITLLRDDIKMLQHDMNNKQQVRESRYY